MIHDAADGDLPGVADGGVAALAVVDGGFLERCIRSSSAAASRLTDVRSVSRQQSESGLQSTKQ